MTQFVKFDDVEVGLEYPDTPVEFKVTEDVVNGYLGATFDASDAYKVHSTAADGKRPAPPTLAAVYMMEAMLMLKSPPGGVHAKQKFAFHKPACVGDTLLTKVRILDKYQKKGRNYVIMQTITTNQAGEPVTTGTITRIWGKEE
ncbi:MAG: MaoC family dehydratase N-terminal domain-containing protein [Gammaproteobacteria bacterium]|nr:MaoC family dehydratase N-terminal domain-containing protein [Gammaproteobacteria bacterium]